MHVVAVPVLGIIFTILVQCIEANLTLDFKVTKISANYKAANCNVANTTYAHGETFKLDCKTQCVCENGRHACSSLCPKEQLPAPEDTISCRSPRLVEVPGHCCKMWLCENPTADVYATCHNSSTSPWTPCSRTCGLGISTRFTTTTAGCNQLSNLRLCENRKCETIQDNTDKPRDGERDLEKQKEVMGMAKNVRQKLLMKTKQLKHKLKRQQKTHHDTKLQQQQQQHIQQEQEHRIRKGHECRSIQRLGPARIRLGQCVSKKLYRPKICGRCHYNTKCCVPSVSTTIQVELLCPLNATEPISFVQQHLTKVQQQQGQHFYPKTSMDSSHSRLSSPVLTSLWDTHSLDAIDQEYLQSRQIQITNKFIAVEWILKCECIKNDNCQRIINTTATTTRDSIRSSGFSSINNNYKNDDNKNVDTDNNSNNIIQNNINSMYYEDYKKIAAALKAQTYIYKIPDDNNNVDEHDENMDVGEVDDDIAENDSDININNSYSNGKGNSNRHIHSFSYNHKKQTTDYAENTDNSHGKNRNNNKNHNEDDEEIQPKDIQEKEWSTSLSSSLLTEPSSSLSSDGVATSSNEIQPDIIPYPPPPFSVNKNTGSGNNHNSNKDNKNNNNNNNNQKNTQTRRLKGKFNLQLSKQKQQQQQYDEHWLLQQYNYNPYQKASLTTA